MMRTISRISKDRTKKNSTNKSSHQIPSMNRNIRNKRSNLQMNRS